MAIITMRVEDEQGKENCEWIPIQVIYDQKNLSEFYGKFRKNAWQWYIDGMASLKDSFHKINLVGTN